MRQFRSTEEFSLQLRSRFCIRLQKLLFALTNPLQRQSSGREDSKSGSSSSQIRIDELGNGFFGHIVFPGWGVFPRRGYTEIVIAKLFFLEKEKRKTPQDLCYSRPFRRDSTTSRYSWVALFWIPQVKKSL